MCCNKDSSATEGGVGTFIVQCTGSRKRAWLVRSRKWARSWRTLVLLCPSIPTGLTSGCFCCLMSFSSSSFTSPFPERWVTRPSVSPRRSRDHSWPRHYYWLKVRSHQTRIARTIYMLSQCKDAKSNPAALFARMRRRELSVLFSRDIRTALTNQELALAVTSLRAKADNPKQQWRTK